MVRSLKHTNIIQIEEIMINGSYLCFVMPLADFGSVTDLLHARYLFGLSETAIVPILYDLFKAVDYIHSRDVIHRGIRCSHILISSDGRAILTGFRNATSVILGGRRVTTIHEFRPEFKQNLLWLAPEVLQQDLAGYGSKSDIYSIGISVCEMANGFPPFSDMAHMQMLFEKLRGTTPRLLDATTLVGEDFPKSGDGAGDGVANEQKDRRFSLHLHNITELCLKSNPSERPSAMELLNHPFFKHAKRHKPPFRDLFHPLNPLAPPSNPESARVSMERQASQESDTVQHDEKFDWHFD